MTETPGNNTPLKKMHPAGRLPSAADVSQSEGPERTFDRQKALRCLFPALTSTEPAPKDFREGFSRGPGELI